MSRIQGPSIRRRHVVGGLCASGALGAFAFAAVRTQDSTTSQTSGTTTQTQTQTLATAEMDRWSRMVGSEFTTAGFSVKLVGVQALNSEGVRPPEVTRDAAFLAVFEVLTGGYMPGDLIYRLTGRNQVLDVFLTNAFTPQFPRRMHAVFN
jgi:hypothetical protein